MSSKNHQERWRPRAGCGCACGPPGAAPSRPARRGRRGGLRRPSKGPGNRRIRPAPGGADSENRRVGARRACRESARRWLPGGSRRGHGHPRPRAARASGAGVQRRGRCRPVGAGHRAEDHRPSPGARPRAALAARRPGGRERAPPPGAGAEGSPRRRGAPAREPPEVDGPHGPHPGDRGARGRRESSAGAASWRPRAGPWTPSSRRSSKPWSKRSWSTERQKDRPPSEGQRRPPYPMARACTRWTRIRAVSSRLMLERVNRSS